MAPDVKYTSVFSVCADRAENTFPFSVTYVCKGTKSDCELIRVFPDVTCTVDSAGTTTTCSGEHRCVGNPVFTTKTEFEIEGDEIRVVKSAGTENCKWEGVGIKGIETCVKEEAEAEPLPEVPTEEDLEEELEDVEVDTNDSDKGDESSSFRTVTLPSIRNLLTLFFLSFLVFPAFASPAIPDLYNSAPISRVNIPLKYATSVFPPNPIYRRDISARASPNPPPWSGFWKTFCKSPIKTVGPGLDIENMYKMFRSMTVREAIRAGMTAGDWALIAKDIWGHLGQVFHEAACRQYVDTVEKRIWKDRTIGKITNSGTELCIQSIKSRVIAAAKDPKQFFGPKADPRAIKRLAVASFVVCDGAVNAAAALYIKLYAPQLGLVSSEICKDTCFDDSFKRLSDPENCGKCGNLCDSGTCLNGVCTITSCYSSALTSTSLTACGAGANSETCACISTGFDTAHCVQYSSSASKSLTDSCFIDSDCPPGSVCGRFPGSEGGGLTCLESTSCLSGVAPKGKTEKLPGFIREGVENGNGLYRPWRLRCEDPETGERLWEENSIHLASLDGGRYMVKKSGRNTGNTNCVPIYSSGDHIPSIGGVVGATPDTPLHFPKNGGFYFGYDSETLLDGDEADTCCIHLYKDTKCEQETEKEFSGGCKIMFGTFSGEVSAFKVSGCGMVIGDVELPGRGGRRLSGSGSTIN